MEAQHFLNPNIDDASLDADLDGMPNLWEYEMDLDPRFHDSGLDPDNDGLTNIEEYLFGSWAMFSFNKAIRNGAIST